MLLMDVTRLRRQHEIAISMALGEWKTLKHGAADFMPSCKHCFAQVRVLTRSKADHICAQELSTLFRFWRRFNLSTLFLCIFSANLSYLSFSSLAALFSRIFCILLYITVSWASHTRLGRKAHLTFCLLLVPHFFLFGLHCGHCYPFLRALFVRGQSRSWSEGLFCRVPLFAYKSWSDWVWTPNW